VFETENINISMITILLAADHAGYALKSTLIERFQATYQPYTDLGTYTSDSVDYPDFAQRLVNAMTDDTVGILICGTGIGMSIAANRFPGIRAAVAVTPEMARLARLHNNANVLALGGRLIDAETAIGIVNTFLATNFEGGRHDRRLSKIDLVGFDAGA